MKKVTEKNCILVSAFCLLTLALPSLARADGNIGFLSTDTTLTAGQPFSWMETGRDWDRSTFGASGHANPQLIQNISVVTRKTGSNLIMVFTIRDGTIRREDSVPVDGTLLVGDKIIIQLDPNNSRTPTGLDVGTNGTALADYRIEIVIKDNNIVSSGFRLAEDANNWDFVNTHALPVAPVFSSVAGPSYQVTLTIPVTMIGSPTSDIGIAFGIVNDLGNRDDAGTSDLTGSAFPASMGMDGTINNIGFIDGEAASGTWVRPANWGRGYFTTDTGNLADVHFEHGSSFYFSNSINVGTCNTTSFGSIVHASDTNQSMLTNWYLYHQTTPCPMRVWLQVHKTAGTGTMRRRFLIMWAVPGTAPGDWKTVALTNPVAVTSAVETFNALWTGVPPNSFVGATSGHPCVRAYILPENLADQASPDAAVTETFIRNITTQAQLDQMETAYNVQPAADLRTAQMNFTNISTTDAVCPTLASCPTASIPGRDRLDAQESGVRFVNASFKSGAGETKGESTPVAAAETTANPPQQTDRPSGLVRIFVAAFGVDPHVPGKPYTFLRSLGGLGYVLTSRDLEKQQVLTLQFEVTNPRLLRRDFTTNPPTEVLSPARNVFLGVTIVTTNGVPTPTYTVAIDRDNLGPGEKTKGTVVVRPVTSTPPGFKRWGLSLHAGISIPHGNFNTVYNPGPNAGVDLEYRINPTFSLEGIYTFHRFRGQRFDLFTVPDLNVHQFSINGKVYGSSSPWRPFFNFGGGAYKFDPGNTRPGLNVGFGVQRDITPTVAIDAMYNYHNVFTPGSQTRFSTVQGGVRFRF